MKYYVYYIKSNFPLHCDYNLSTVIKAKLKKRKENCSMANYICLLVFLYFYVSFFTEMHNPTHLSPLKSSQKSNTNKPIQNIKYQNEFMFSFKLKKKKKAKIS